MRLVGGTRTIPTKNVGEDLVAAFYRTLIPRLLSEVDRNGRPSRLVGFRTMINESYFWQFLAVEVESFSTIPDGMTGLALGGSRGEVVGNAGAINHFPLNWRWEDRSGVFPVGEFTAVIPHHVPELSCFAPSTNAYIGADNAVSAEDAIELVNYNGLWPRQFCAMAGWLRGVLPAGTQRIEHYGSTAIPGMPAKPIIDILVEMPSFAAARRSLIPALNLDTWEYWWYGDHMIFIKRERLNGPRTHHVHIAPPGHRLWEGLAFRDYLIAHPEAGGEYAAMKRDLAVRFRDDREKYTDAKTGFVRAITDRALFERA